MVSWMVVALDLAVNDEGNAVAGLVDVRKVVGGHDDGASASYVRAHGPRDDAHVGGVERAHGLVEKQQFRSGCHGRGYGGELGHSLRALANG